MLRTSTVSAHLASRTIRFATDQLTALAQAKGIAGIAGLGHMLLTAGMILLFLSLGKALRASNTTEVLPAAEVPAA